MTQNPLLRRSAGLGRIALAMALGASLAGCGGMATNRQLYSVHQPVVSHASFTLDLAIGPEGLGAEEPRRLADWLTAMNVRYGDRVSLDDPQANPATRAAVEQVLSHYGLILSRETAPVAAVSLGMVRVTITRASAEVPGCPDWSANSETNWHNATSTNYGCAVNSNVAAMIANPDDLLRGSRSSGTTTVLRNDKAINAYYSAQVSGAGGASVKAVSAGGN